MARAETITVAKKAADVWRGTDTYHQAAQIIDMLVSELEGEPTLTPPNEALTLEQLRDMDGEPVYLVAPKYGISEWNVLNGMDEIVLAYDEPVVGMKAVVPGIKFINGRVFGVGSYARRREMHE